MLDKKYNKVALDIKNDTAKYPNMIFAIDDENTSDFYIEVKRDGVILDLTDYDIELNVLKPNKNLETKKLTYDKELKIYDLERSICDIIKNRYRFDESQYNKFINFYDFFLWKHKRKQ